MTPNRTDLPLMDTERAELARLAEVAELGSSEVGRSRFDAVLQALFGRSLEAAAPTIDAMARACMQGGRTCAESAIGAHGIRIFSPAIGATFLKALAIETAGTNFVAIVRHSRTPEGERDASASGVPGLGEADEEQARREVTSSPEIEMVSVLRYWTPFPGFGNMPTDADGCARAVAQLNRHACSYRPTLEETLAKARGRGFQTNAILEARMSSPPFAFGASAERQEWQEGTRRVFDIQASLGFFSALRGAVSVLGAQEHLLASAGAFAGRRFQELPGYPDLAAARTLGDLLARRDGYLPGAAAGEGLGALMALGAARELPDLLEDMEALRALCIENGHTEEDESFGYNADDFVHAPPSGRPDLDLMAFEDQACHYVVALRRDAAGAIREASFYLADRSVAEWFEENFFDGISAETLSDAMGSHFANPYADAPVADPVGAITAAIAGADTSLLARFILGEDGPTCVADTFLQGDRASMWTRVVNLVQSGRCCMEEGYGVEPDGPGV